jgi:DNA-binding SARP family transcriptional activator
MIKLRLLGEIQLRATPPDGAEVDALLRQSKRLALLAYLASPAPGTWHRRDVLLALFWPELDTAHARTSLRNALHVLRRTLGDAILRTRGDEEVSIDPALVLRISEQVDHPFRFMSISRFGRCRSPVSDEADHPFRSMSISDFG